MIDIEHILDDDEDMVMHGVGSLYCDPDCDTDPAWEAAKVDLDKAILAFSKEAESLGVYMPSLATYLRIHADELADKYPDDINGGSPL